MLHSLDNCRQSYLSIELMYVLSQHFFPKHFVQCNLNSDKLNNVSGIL